MRLDKYLKVSRLIKRRTVANEEADAGRIHNTGQPAKATLRLLSVVAPRTKEVAREMYVIM